jgi:23S rRNA (pseudouridine1915-N3)-methyltransferase
LRVHVVAFGKLKTPGMAESAEYYARLLRPWVPVDCVELKPMPVTEKSPAARKQVQAREGELLLERLEALIGSRGAIYLLEEEGKALSTDSWAAEVRRWENASLSGLAFCVGSSLGFSEEVRARARGRLSLGPQTLPHELARVVLLEQLYRAWSVVRGHPYHNAGS